MWAASLSVQKIWVGIAIFDYQLPHYWLKEQIYRKSPNDKAIEEPSDQLSSLLSKGIHLRCRLQGQNGGYHLHGVPDDIRPHVDGVGDDGDGVAQVSSEELYAHEQETEDA